MEKPGKTPYERNKEFISYMDNKLFLREYTTIMMRCSDGPEIRSYVENSITEQHKNNSSPEITKLNQMTD